MQKEFDMFDLGLLKYFLSMEIWQFSYGIFLSEKKYASKLLKTFHMENCKATTTPLVQNLDLMKDGGAVKIDDLVYKSLIDSILYLTITRPNLMYSASPLLRFMSSLYENYFATTKRILMYVKDTINYRKWYLQ